MSAENQTNADRSDISSSAPRPWQVSPRPFTSNVPLIGPLIVAFRQVWYNVAARWQDLSLFEQQNRFNHAVQEMLEHQERKIEYLEREMMDLKERWLSDIHEDIEQQWRQFAEVRQSQEYANHLLYERGLEIGILAEGLAQSKLEAKDENRR